MVEGTVVGEEEEAFAVVVEAAGDVYARRQTELRERWATFRVRELRVDEVRLVESDQQQGDQPRFE
ncbi:MAG TPA: hypothetical protein VMZ53_25015 [Kofleriaceae bacterium]|nr:hypothetical protein [Kofleriaceae bacterium]